jgi:hypothetical protein
MSHSTKAQFPVSIKWQTEPYPDTRKKKKKLKVDRAIQSFPISQGPQNLSARVTSFFSLTPNLLNPEQRDVVVGYGVDSSHGA